MSARYILREDEDGQFRFSLTTHSGQVLLTSAVYRDKDSALRAIDSARRLAHNERNYQLLTAEDELSYFVIKNSRQQVIGQSDMYTNTESLRQAMMAVKGITRGARLEDLTNRIVKQGPGHVKLW